jgi:L-ascorbate metabolism protein UlaG (beta-lactamase superfamily)
MQQIVALFTVLRQNNPMVITYYGGDCFKVQFGDTVVAVNPMSKAANSRAPRFGADIALVSANIPEYNGVEQVQSNGKELFVIDGPGEYEIKGVVVKGYPYPEVSPRHTFFFLVLEGINLCFLSGLAKGELLRDMQEEMSEVDILFIPVGSDSDTGLSPADAYKLAVALEPSYIIPMGHNKKKDALVTFIKEGGVEGPKPVDKFTVKRRDVEAAEGEIVVLSEAVS